MNDTSFLGLIQNAALLLAAALIFGVAAIRWRTGQSPFRQVPVGISLGAIGIAIMLTPWTFVPGIVFDTRSVLIGISGLFFGSVSTAIAMAMTAAFRFYQGGTGVWTGVAVILTSGAIGIAWRHFRRRPLAEISWCELYLFGMVVHIAMLAMMLTLPWETALRVLSNIALPVLVIYPIGTALLGVLIVTRRRREQTEEALRESEELYRSLFENMLNGFAYCKMLFDQGRPQDFIYLNVNSAFESLTGLKDVVGRKVSEVIPGIRESDEGLFEIYGRVALTGKPERFETYVEALKMWFSVSVYSPEEEYFVAVFDVITERKNGEEELRKTLDSLRRAVGTTVQVMVSAVEARDPYTAGHQIRSANIARAIATEMGLPKEKIDAIRMAGSIHDIGKLSVPVEILSKPTKLSPIEFSLIKTHSRSGYEILKNVESSWPLAEIVYQHHERMDGSGYPRNLKGKEILIEARILAVSDVVESMASHRPYRPALGIDMALKEIENYRDILYDADVVDACVKVFREKGFQFE